jgi:hypothetical protein
LYRELYEINNMVEDSGAIFQTYADMMTYEPVSPGDEFKYRKWILRDKDAWEIDGMAGNIYPEELEVEDPDDVFEEDEEEAEEDEEKDEL